MEFTVEETLRKDSESPSYSGREESGGLGETGWHTIVKSVEYTKDTDRREVGGRVYLVLERYLFSVKGK